MSSLNKKSARKSTLQLSDGCDKGALWYLLIASDFGSPYTKPFSKTSDKCLLGVVWSYGSYRRVYVRNLEGLPLGNPKDSALIIQRHRYLINVDRRVTVHFLILDQ